MPVYPPAMALARCRPASSVVALVALVALATLSACGGGGGGSSTPPPPTPPAAAATVTSVTAAGTAYDAPMLVTVAGTNLDGGIVVSSPGCGSLARLTVAPNASTSTTAYYQCTLSTYAGTVTVASSAGTALGAAAFSVPAPAVTGADAVATRYGASVLMTVTGSHLLDAGLAATATGCANLTLLTQAPNVSTSTTAFYQCTASGAYSGTLTLRDGFGKTVDSSATFTVPPPIVTMSVSNGAGVNGNLVIALEGDKAPITVDNFLAYVNSGFYDGLIFHRVVPGFVAQAGGYGPSTNGALPAPKATNAPIPLETTGGNNVQWSLAMARTSAPNSATSQFFINLVANPSLDGATGYAVFGNLTTPAIAVAQAIAAAPAACTSDPAAGTDDCLPTPNVVITSATQTQ